MNDEIKEIIEYFKDDINYLEEELKYPNFKGRYITIRDKECEYLRKLLDYITNLQQENERLLKQLENVSLDEANIRADILLEQQDYKSRNEKAIEYVKSNEFIGKIRLSSENKQSINKLLDILQGNNWNEVERAYLDDKPIGSDKDE